MATVPGLIDFDVAVFEHEGGAGIRVRGEVDAYTAPALEERLSALVDDGMRDIVIDAADLTFMDTTGLATLIRTLERVRDDDGRVLLRSPPRSIEKTLEIAGLDTFLLENRA